MGTLVRRRSTLGTSTTPPQLVEAGELAAARQLGEDLATRYPRSSRARVLLAQCDWLEAERARGEGEAAASRAALERAWTRLAPLLESPPPASREAFRVANLGARVALARGDARAAARLYAEARRFDADNFALRLHLVRARRLASAEDPDAAARGELEALSELAARFAEQAASSEDRAWFRLELARLDLELDRRLREGDEAAALAARQRGLIALRALAAEDESTAGLRAAARVDAARLQLELGARSPPHGISRRPCEKCPATRRPWIWPAAQASPSGKIQKVKARRSRTYRGPQRVRILSR